MVTLSIADMTDSERSRLAKQPNANLRCPATTAMPRQLHLDLENGRLYVHVYAPGLGFIQIAGGVSRIEECNLHPRGMTAGNACLYVGPDILFRLTNQEAAEVERVFAPLGLNVMHAEDA